MFQETGDRTNFQGRYVVRHAWTGSADCPAADAYRQALAERQRQEAANLANLTGWDINEIRARMNLPVEPEQPRWWEWLWRD